LPLLAEGLRAAHPSLKLTVAGAVGEDPGVLAAMTDYCVRSIG
jgi:sirohydrochlorin cobaltochelatase